MAQFVKLDTAKYAVKQQTNTHTQKHTFKVFHSACNVWLFLNKFEVVVAGPHIEAITRARTHLRATLSTSTSGCFFGGADIMAALRGHEWLALRNNLPKFGKNVLIIYPSAITLYDAVALARSRVDIESEK